MMQTHEAQRGEYNFLPLEKVIFGAGCASQIAAEADRLGCRRALVITGQSLATRTPLIRKIEGLLGTRHAATFSDIRQHVPESGIAQAVELARACKVDLLVSVGGGSPIDAAKAVAHRLAQQAASNAAYLPHIAISTTLSAAEFSHLAGFTDESRKAKTGFQDPRATPRVVILDPEMTLHTPAWLWLASGMRAIDHAVETLYTPGYHPVNDRLALEAIRTLFAWLPRSRSEPASLDARLECQLAAWMSYFGPGSVNAAAGLSHTIGKRIGATFDVPHGVTSCILLPEVMRAKADTPAAAQLAPMAQALQLVTPQASDREAAWAAAQAVADLVKQLELPNRLRDLQVPLEALDGIAAATVSDPPARLEVLEILKRAW
ncbi:MAG TPA: iron-containing alcohol dehydrogenase [Anaerolineales bacterium]|nr:iron-containing alcohol dehydrogenase [Anaerolineales bacterium]